MKYAIRFLTILFVFLASASLSAAQLPDFTELAEKSGQAVVNMDGGILDWQAAGLPVITEG